MLRTQVSELELDGAEGQMTQVVTLPDISWQTYQAMLSDMGEHRAARLSYYQGTLTLKMPSQLHEIINRLLARIVTTLTEELDLDVVNIGSTTLGRESKKAGAEPDTGFYIQNALRLEGLDPAIPDKLPPDLVVEVDITSPSTRRLTIYKVLGVAEVWQYTKREGVRMYALEADEYVRVEASIAFPKLTVTTLNGFLEMRQGASENQVIRAVRAWATLQPEDITT